MYPLPCYLTRQSQNLRPFDNDVFSRLFAKALQCPSQTNNESGVGPSMASMKESEKTPLASLYGAVQGLAELGPEVVKVLTSLVKLLVLNRI